MIKEQLEWRNNFYTERTERFDPPMWEDIEDHYEFAFKYKNDFCWFDVKKHNYIEVTLNKDIFAEENIFRTYRVTKENYEKACEMVRDLFKGD